MSKRIEVENVEVEDNKGKIITKLNENYSGLSASGRMLVDSDSFSFIYILEDKDSYIYLSLPESTWKDLKNIIEKELPVFLVQNQEHLELKSLKEELKYLVENIEGNPNHGDEMVKKVEAIFI